MKGIDTSGPAFPEPGLSGLPNGEFVHGRSGMSLRDYFAAKAMQGYLANSSEGFASIAMAAEFCYDWADEMLKAREVQK